MSAFGSTFPAAPAATWSFGTQPAIASTAQPQAALGGFGSFGATLPMSTAAPAPATLPSFGFGQPTQAAAMPVAGLGGTRSDTTFTSVQPMGTQSVKTPRETEVPAEIEAAFRMLEQRIKENRELAEEIAATDSKMLDQLGSNYRSTCDDYGKAVMGVQKLIQAVRTLKTESRQNLLDGELAQRLQKNFPMNFDFSAPLNYLLRLAEHYEKLILAFSEELQRLEKIIFGRTKPVTADEILAHLKHVEMALRYLTSKVYEMDQTVQELKDSFKDYRRVTYGDAGKFFASGATSSASSCPTLDRIEGPSPFSSWSSSAMLVIANTLSRAQAGAGIAPSTGLPQQTFGTQPSIGFSLQQPLQPQPFGTSQLLFRPFGSSSVSSAVTTAVASGALSFPSLAPSTTTSAPAAATTAASPWRFSSPFNTSSSGTLFGGTATNIGAVKPLGLATPLQQTPGATSLQLLNPPLGSKRGKS